MRAADTNVLVRLVVRDDLQQTEAAEEFAREGVWVSHLALAELALVLESVYDFPPADIEALVSMLLDSPSVAFQDVDVVMAALAHIRARPSIGLSDCLLLEIARKAGQTPIGSFDRDFAKLPGVERLR
jgi:predicted nucleic acid-binding protein